MNITVQEMDHLLKSSNKPIRRANEYDLILIKNELISLLSSQYDTSEQQQIRQLINELHLLNITVERDDEYQVIYAYKPPEKFNKRLTLFECGWIALRK